MPRFGAASSVGRERLVLVAALLPRAQSQRLRPPPSAASPLSCLRSPHRGYWWHRGFPPPRHQPVSRLPLFCLPRAPRTPRLPTVGGWGAMRHNPAPAKHPCFCRARAGHPYAIIALMSSFVNSELFNIRLADYGIRMPCPSTLPLQCPSPLPRTAPSPEAVPSTLPQTSVASRGTTQPRQPPSLRPPHTAAGGFPPCPFGMHGSGIKKKFFKFLFGRCFCLRPLQVEPLPPCAACGALLLPAMLPSASYVGARRARGLRRRRHCLPPIRDAPCLHGGVLPRSCPQPRSRALLPAADIGGQPRHYAAAATTEPATATHRRWGFPPCPFGVFHLHPVVLRSDGTGK